LTLIATLLHLDRFHLSSADLVAQTAAWVWLAVYVIVPIALAILIFFQWRVPGEDPERVAPMPAWYRSLLFAQAFILIALGVILFLYPTSPFWPWTLTPLTGRAIASWLIGIGSIVTHASLENDWSRTRPMMLGYLALGVLQFSALARYATLIDWSKPHGALYIVFLASILLVGVYGWLAARRIKKRYNPYSEIMS
jgi:hypothetical protein